MTVKNRPNAEPVNPTGDTKNVAGTGNKVTNMANKKATPVRTTTQSSKQLPKTGEESTSLTVTVIGSFMVLAAFALKRLKKVN